VSRLFASSPLPLFFVLAIDPGRDKCGLALLRGDGEVLKQSVVRTAEVGDTVAVLVQRHPGAVVIVGDRTGGRDISATLDQRLQQKTVLVDEHRSTEEGRRRYFRENPPRGWRRLLPLGLQTPPKPYDDYVAVILAERYLESLRSR
jgi:RNase H-fold protein (predicted Holliday junction resolvase)